VLLYGNGSHEGPHEPGPDEPQRPTGKVRWLGFVNHEQKKYEVAVDDAGVFWARPLT